MLEAALTRWVLARQQVAQQDSGPVAEGRPVLAVDGKSLRGARGSDGRQAKLVCVYDHAHPRS